MTTILSTLTDDELIARLGLGDDSLAKDEIIRRIYKAKSIATVMGDDLGAIEVECEECFHCQRVDVHRDDLQ